MSYFTVYDIAVAQGIALAKNEWEAQLREQIAREIPELIVELKAYWNEQSMFDGFDYITDENFERILNFVAAAIARGK